MRYNEYLNFSLYQIKEFLALCEHLNYTKAAKECFVTQSTPVSYTHLDVYKRQSLYGVRQDTNTGIQNHAGIYGKMVQRRNRCV